MLLISGIVVFRFIYPPYSILTWDVFGYYLYLPALFIHNDLGLKDISWVHQMVEQYQTTATLYQVTALPDGGWVMKYSSGIALLNLPAFLIAHFYSYLAGYKSDGFSAPYQLAWAISGLVYTAIGLWIMRRILLRYFSDSITSVLLLLLVLATNYFQLTAFDGYLSHNYLFTVYTFILWYTIKWHEKPNIKYALGLGISLGLAILSRPNEMVALLLPVLWNIYNRESFQAKVLLFKKHFPHLLVAGFSLALIGSLQLLYWKYTTGSWLYYSYNNAGEGFDFTHPYILQVLFSFRKGWLIYTPVMAFALAGFLILYKRNKALFVPLLVYFIVNLYIISSWTCWWYAGGSYSQRALLSSYVILLLPMGYMIDYLLNRQKLIRVLFIGLLSLLLILNLFQTWQWVHGIIDGTRMSKAYYFAVFAKTHATEVDQKLLLVERSIEAFEKLENESEYTGKIATLFDFEGQKFKKLNISTDTVHSGKAALRMNAQYPYSPAYEASFEALTSHDHAWIRASVWVYPLQDVASGMASLVITFEHKGELYGYRAIGIDRSDFHIKTAEWNYISMDYLTPEVRSTSDKVKVYFWLQGDSPLLIDDLKIEVFEPNGK